MDLLSLHVLARVRRLEHPQRIHYEGCFRSVTSANRQLTKKFIASVSKWNAGKFSHSGEMVKHSAGNGHPRMKELHREMLS